MVKMLSGGINGAMVDRENRFCVVAPHIHIDRHSTTYCEASDRAESLRIHLELWRLDISGEDP